MSARYLVRFDDITAGMAWERWEQIEDLLRAHHVKPLLAVVPDNIDPKLEVDDRRDDFWDRVRGWQADGWSIGLHGHHHDYVNRNGGILGLNRNSEFAGLTYDEQREKIQAGLAVFTEHGVTADAWVAPSHSFDQTTVRALLDEGIDVISDGFGLRAGKAADGAVWVPQQIWRFASRPAGTWTVCLHHNGWSDDDLDQFDQGLQRFGPQIVSLADVVAEARSTKLTAADSLLAGTQRGALLTKRRVASAVRR